MTPRKTARVYVDGIRAAVRRIERYTRRGREAFLGDTQCQDAVIRNLAIIGEAARKLPDAVTAAYPEVPWRSVVGMRNVLIHDYSATSIPRVWDTVERDLPELRRVADAMARDPRVMGRLTGRRASGRAGPTRG